MTYENELKSWEVVEILSQKDDYVKFAFEKNETVTSSENTTVQSI